MGFRKNILQRVNVSASTKFPSIRNGWKFDISDGFPWSSVNSPFLEQLWEANLQGKRHKNQCSLIMICVWVRVKLEDEEMSFSRADFSKKTKYSDKLEISVSFSMSFCVYRWDAILKARVLRSSRSTGSAVALKHKVKN